MDKSKAPRTAQKAGEGRFDSTRGEEPWQIVYHTITEKYSLFCRNVGKLK